MHAWCAQAQAQAQTALVALMLRVCFRVQMSAKFGLSVIHLVDKLESSSKARTCMSIMMTIISQS
jgi:hypothetical protein